ncbi:MAG: helix-turn-helix transcriptional regulator [Polyangiales bacterium]
MTRDTRVVDTTFRHWQMLRLIPRAPKKIDAARIESLLASEQIEIHRRSVQRDLEALSLRFRGLECDRRSKPYGWSWSADAPTLEVPAMGLSTAVTLELVHAHLLPAMPRVAVRALGPTFERARAVLTEHAPAKLARWTQKIRVVASGAPMIPPIVRPLVLDVVYEALLEGRRFRARYRRRGAMSDRDYDVAPLGLVMRAGVLVLVCTLSAHEDVCHLHLHRMSRAESTADVVRVPAGFDLDEHITSGALGFTWSNEKLKLRLLLSRLAAISLHETPISDDQRITPHDEERELLTASVPDSLEIRKWLRGYGADAEVLAPARLRSEMEADARATLRRYRARTKPAT